MSIRVGTLAAAAMLTGPLQKRRELLARAADAALDPIFVPDPVSFHTGMGMGIDTIARVEQLLEP